MAKMEVIGLPTLHYSQPPTTESRYQSNALIETYFSTHYFVIYYDT